MSRIAVNHSVSVKGPINRQLYLALQECKIEVRVPIAGKNYAGVPYGDGHDLYMVRSFVNFVKCRSLDDPICSGSLMCHCQWDSI